MEQLLYVDNGKRARIIFSAVLIAVSLFVIRALNLISVDNIWHLVAMSASYFFLAYIALLWSLRFQVRVPSLLFIIPQSSLFVALQALFVVLYFFSGFQRIYEFFLLFMLLSFMSVTVYVSFLMANVFNVATFKPIPLEQVARTTSFIITLMMVFFTTFNMLSLGVNPLFTLPILIIIYAASLFYHLFHLSVSTNELVAIVAILLFSMLSTVIAGLFLDQRHEIIALMPLSVAFGGLGIEMNRIKSGTKFYLIMEFFILFVSSVLLVLYI